MASAGNAVPVATQPVFQLHTIPLSQAAPAPQPAGQENADEEEPKIFEQNARRSGGPNGGDTNGGNTAGPERAGSEHPKLIILRRSWRSLLPRLLAAVAVLLAGVSASDGMRISSPMSIAIGGNEVPIELALFCLISLMLLVRPVMLRFDGYSQVRHHHLVTIRGILSLRRQQINIPYEDIRGVKVDQMIWERLLGCGTLVCWSVSADHPEIRIPGVAHVHREAVVISGRVDGARIERRQNDPFRGERLRRILAAPSV